MPNHVERKSVSAELYGLIVFVCATDSIKARDKLTIPFKEMGL